MTGREWKPGDVALCVWKDYPPTYALQRPNGRWEDFQGAIGADLVAEFRPLVVIDPEDREQVKRLWRIWTTLAPDHRLAQDCMQAALLEFANPKPPKPDEPTGLGAVVRASDGTRWIRFSYGEWWFNADSPAGGLRWADLDVVEVLTEGVTA